MSEYLSIETLDALGDGSAVITHGVVWVKVGRAWYCPSAPPARRVRDSAWMAKVAKRVIFDVAEWEVEQGYRRPTANAVGKALFGRGGPLATPAPPVTVPEPEGGDEE